MKVSELVCGVWDHEWVSVDRLADQMLAPARQVAAVELTRDIPRGIAAGTMASKLSGIHVSVSAEVGRKAPVAGIRLQSQLVAQTGRMSRTTQSRPELARAQFGKHECPIRVISL